MPQLGETVTEGTVTRWLKAVGDPVAQDEVLFEVSTDKVDSEVPSSAAGYLAEILVPEGETVDVGARLAVITPEPPGAAGAISTPADATPAAEATPPAAPPPAVPTPPAPPAPAPPPQIAHAPAAPVEAPPVAPPPSPPQPATPVLEPVGVAPGAGGGAANGVNAGPAPSGGELAGRVLSPVVRRLLAEHRIDPSEIVGSGLGGRITRADVLAYVDARTRAGAAPSAPPLGGTAPPSAGQAPSTPPAGAPAPAGGPAGAPSGLVPAGAPPAVVAGPSPVLAGSSAGPRDEVVPFSNIRRRTAEHMVRSKATSAHTLVSIEVDFDAVDRLRRAVKEEFRAREGVNLTYLPFVARALVDAVRAFPHVNASVGDDALIVHHDIHLGIAVDLDVEGLIVPVIHDAAAKRLPALAREIADLASRARSRRLSADDIAGGTITITNPGPYGTLLTAPIINQPQVAILSTDGVKRRPVVVGLPDGTEGIAIHSVGNLALSFDHRAVDGGYASRFLGRMKESIEGWDWAQEL